VERWSADAEQPEIVSGLLTWQPAPSRPVFTLDLDVVCAEALGER
jgi:hypothetical protein